MATTGTPMNEELDNRLDELFDDGTPKESAKNGGPLENLKALILEMEWEIGDRNLDAYLTELKRVAVYFQDDKALLIYVKLLDTIGRYLKAKKASAHVETVSFLKALFESFEKTVNTPMSQGDRNRLAAAQVSAFKRFKTAISSHTGSGHKGRAPSPGPSEEAGTGLSDETKTYIRQVVREEIARLIKRK